MTVDEIRIEDVTDPAVARVAAQMWVAADEARARRTIPARYVDQQRTGFVETAARPDAWLAVASEAREVIGLVGGFPATDDEGRPIDGVAYLAWIAVVPTRWSRGIGDRLLAHAEERARRSGNRAIELWVHGDNSRARRAYERRGWRHSGRTMRTPVDDEELVEYRLDLAPRVP